MTDPLTLHAFRSAWPGVMQLASVIQRLSSSIATSCSRCGNIGSGSFLPVGLLVVMMVSVLLVVMIVFMDVVAVFVMRVVVVARVVTAPSII